MLTILTILTIWDALDSQILRVFDEAGESYRGERDYVLDPSKSSFNGFGHMDL